MTSQLKKWAENHSEILLMTLFGSFSDGRATESSDLDLAILTPAALTDDQRVNLSQELGSLFNREIDLVDLFQAHGTILKEALTRSSLIINREPDVYARLLKRFFFEEADYGPLRARALAERRDRVFKTEP